MNRRINKMKQAYTTPEFKMIAQENADVLTLSIIGEGERMAWKDGTVRLEDLNEILREAVN